MIYAILDCYTDEPAGLGVPPYLGTYPRYLAGAILEQKDAVYYLTIDDLRLLKKFSSKPPKHEKKTNIRIHNLTSNCFNAGNILKRADVLVIVAGVQTPGKYLSAEPATIKEITRLVSGLKCKKVLTGPAVFGTQLEGGKFFERTEKEIFDFVDEAFLGISDYEKIKKFAVRGAEILKQIPYPIIAEIETGGGCPRMPGCSFCTEPIKSKLEFREQKDIHSEMKALYSYGARHFRLGKQSCFYSYKNYSPDEIKNLLEPIRKSFPEIKTLHIDNVNPSLVIREKGRQITELIVKYCTAGNVAAFGVESFDEKVIKDNNLNTTPEQTVDAVKIINEVGGKRADNGMHHFLPGINLLFGLKSESKESFEKNYYWLKKILDSNLLLRRINIRQVAIFKGTKLHEEVGNKFIKKNKKYYWSWRHMIRQQIDLPMLKKLVPTGTIIKDARAEIYDGNTTFCRQFGSYPLIIGIKKRLELNKLYNIKVTAHMLRSAVGEIAQNI
jgi:radical SAM superfamily enzyme with C-terminal helix-hairpin-helix motif